MIAHIFGGGGAGAAQQLATYRNFVDVTGSRPDFMAGTSAGGLVCTLIAHCGLMGAEEELLSIESRKDIFADNFLGWGKLGLWSPKPLQKILQRIMKYKAKIPYYTTAYNIKAQHTQYFKESDGWYYGAATACIPVLVEPVDCYIDGGIAENTPLALPIKKGATDIHIFTCFANKPLVPDMPKTKLELIAECYNAMMLEIYRNDMKVCEYMSKNGNKPVTVQMHSPRQDLIGVLDFHKMREVYKKIRFENNLQTVMDDR
jgi:predicted acylesterase/phospholipase RssA